MKKSNHAGPARLNAAASIDKLPRHERLAARLKLRREFQQFAGDRYLDPAERALWIEARRPAGPLDVPRRSVATLRRLGEAAAHAINGAAMQSAAQREILSRVRFANFYDFYDGRGIRQRGSAEIRKRQGEAEVVVTGARALAKDS
jgi:hypothetical protein